MYRFCHPPALLKPVPDCFHFLYGLKLQFHAERRSLIHPAIYGNTASHQIYQPSCDTEPQSRTLNAPGTVITAEGNKNILKILFRHAYPRIPNLKAISHTPACGTGCISSTRKSTRPPFGVNFTALLRILMSI